MPSRARDTGISVVGSVPWGTHFCQLYRTKQDLLDTLVPYFREGLEHNEFCLWVTAEPLSVQEAEDALRAAVPDLQSRLENHQLEIIPYDQWYTVDVVSERDRVRAGWITKLEEALGQGCEGLRLSVDTSWLPGDDWFGFADYADAINQAVRDYPMLALCTYSLDKCGASEIAYAIANHQFALVERAGEWTVIESSEYKRTREALRRSEQQYEMLFSRMSEGFALHQIICDEGGHPVDYRFLDINPAFEKITGLSRETTLGHTVKELLPGIEQTWIDRYGQVALTRRPAAFEHYAAPIGRHFNVSAFSPAPGQFACLFSDITDRKEAENSALMAMAELDKRNEELRSANERATWLARFPEENPNPVIRVSADGTIIYSNPAAVRMNDWQCEVGTPVPEPLVEPVKLAMDRVQFTSQDVQLGERIYAVWVTPFPTESCANVYGYDITQRKSAEEELRRQQDLLVAVTMNTSAQLVYLDRDFNFVWVNTAYSKSCAKSPEELVGRNHFEIYPHEENQAIFEQVRDTGVPFEIKEKPFVFPDHPEWGTTYWDWSLIPIKDADDVVQSLVFSLVDVTHDVIARQEIERLETAARQRAAEMESLFASIADGVCLLDADGRVTFMNEAARELLAPPENLQVTNRDESLRAYSLDGTPISPDETATGRALRGETVRGLRYVLSFPWGKSLTVAATSSPVRDAEGRVVGATSVFRDASAEVAFERRQENLLERERRIAVTLQEALVPSDIPSRVGSFRIVAKYQPALEEAEIGGDFYDVFHIEGDKYGILIGDVAGKGLAAAIRVAAARYSIRSYAMVAQRPAATLSLANEALCRGFPAAEHFMTVFFAVLHANSRTLAYTNAGHEPPVIISRGGLLQELRGADIPLGVNEGTLYSEDTREIRPGERFVVVTDGVCEARTAEKESYTKERLCSYLIDRRENDPEDLASSLLADVNEFAGGHPQDDIAILMIDAD